MASFGLAFLEEVLRVLLNRDLVVRSGVSYEVR